MTDSADDIVLLLNNGWNISNVPKPITLDLIEKFKRVDLGGDQDSVLVYMSAGDITPVGLGYGSEQDIQPVTIDIRTTKDKTRLLALLTEVKRIIHANRRKAQNGLHDLIVYQNENPMSNKTVHLWRYIVEVEIRDFAKPISG